MDLDMVLQLAGEMDIENPPWRVWSSRDHMNGQTHWHARIDLILHADTAGELQDKINELNGRTVASLAEDD